jgi:hypothetical protein
MEALDSNGNASMVKKNPAIKDIGMFENMPEMSDSKGEQSAIQN